MAGNDVLGRSHYGPQGHGWQDLQRGVLCIATHKKNIKALGIVVLEKKLCSCFPFVSLLELSVAMETRIPALM